jgi:hypothetical protein
MLSDFENETLFNNIEGLTEKEEDLLMGNNEFEIVAIIESLDTNIGGFQSMWDYLKESLEELLTYAKQVKEPENIIMYISQKLKFIEQQEDKEIEFLLELDEFKKLYAKHRAEKANDVEVTFELTQYVNR